MKGRRRRVWTWTKILSPNILRFVAIYALFAKTTHLSRKKVNMLLTKVFMAIFALAERLPTFATLALLRDKRALFAAEFEPPASIIFKHMKYSL